MLIYEYAFCEECCLLSLLSHNVACLFFTHPVSIGLRRAVNTPVDLSLHSANLVMMDPQFAANLQENFLDTPGGSMMGASNSFGLPYEVLAPVVRWLVLCSASRESAANFEELVGAALFEAFLCDKNGGNSAGVLSVWHAYTAIIVFQKLVRAWAPLAAAASENNTEPTAHLAEGAAMIETRHEPVNAGKVASQSQQFEAWRWSLPQTALLLRYATFSPFTRFSLAEQPWKKGLGRGVVSMLQKEFSTHAEAAMTAGDAAGEPVDLIELMEWLDPLLYR